MGRDRQLLEPKTRVKGQLCDDDTHYLFDRPGSKKTAVAYSANEKGRKKKRPFFLNFCVENNT